MAVDHDEDELCGASVVTRSPLRRDLLTRIVMQGPIHVDA